MIRLVALLMILTAADASAQSWPDRQGDIALTYAEVVDLTTGRTLTFYDDGQSRFSDNGAYSYTYANGGGTAYGEYEIGPDGVVCISYPNGFDRCDRYVRNAGRIVMQTEKGLRFPIRP